MRFCLVTAATTTWSTEREAMEASLNRSPPLGTLAVAGCLESLGIVPSLFDLNHAYAEWVVEREGCCGTAQFVAGAAASLSAVDADVFGFSTICSSYPTTLQLVVALKRKRPDIRAVLGGPQGTAVAEETIRAFPTVDIIVRGEAELILPRLVDALETGATLDSVPGITYRSAGEVCRNPDARVIEDLDSLPPPAFHLDPHLKDRRSLALELGRGCPFSCAFCSTSDFFRRRYRLKSPERVVEQMLHLHRTYGVSHFDLVHDNFAVNRNRVVEFCHALIASRVRLRWGCSARTDGVDDELLDLMWKAGCRGIFFGVECGSARMQALIGKKLNIEDARQRIHQADRRKLATAVALMTGFPEETSEDLRQTVHFFVDAMRYDYAEPQLSLLSPLAGSAIYRQHRNGLTYDDVVSDMAFQGLEQDPTDREMIAAHPDVFSSFYSVPTRWLDRHDLQELRLFLLYGEFHLRWLLVGVHQATGDILKVFEAWVAWRRTHSRPDQKHSVTSYYAAPLFPREFASFVRTELVPNLPQMSVALQALVDYQSGLKSPDKETGCVNTSAETGARNGACARPRCASGIQVVRLDADYACIIRCLRRRESVAGMARRQTTVATRHRAGRMEIVQLSPSSAELLALCNGRREVREIVRLFADRFPAMTGVRARRAGLWGLNLLHRQGIITDLHPKKTLKPMGARLHRSELHVA